LECVYQALHQNKAVVTLARNVSKLRLPPGSGGEHAGEEYAAPQRQLLTAISGSVTNADDVERVFNSASDISSVIVVLGGRTKDVGPTMLTDGTRNIIASMKRRGIRRIAVVTSIGTGDSIAQAPWTFKLLMWTVMRSIMADKNNQEGLFLAPDGAGHELEYVIVRPGQLGEGAPTGIVTVIDGKAGSIHRADLASFVLKAVLERSFAYVRKAVSVSSIHGTSWKKDTTLEGFDKVTKVEL
jgi:hypothetical protein